MDIARSSTNTGHVQPNQFDIQTKDDLKTFWGLNKIYSFFYGRPFVRRFDGVAWNHFNSSWGQTVGSEYPLIRMKNYYWRCIFFSFLLGPIVFMCRGYMNGVFFLYSMPLWIAIVCLSSYL